MTVLLSTFAAAAGVATTARGNDLPRKAVARFVRQIVA